MDDSLLIKLCESRDKNAQKELYQRYAPKMMGVCLRYCSNRDTAQDLLHDGFLKAFTHIGSYTGKGSLEGWLRKIFVNLAIENYRQEKKKSTMLTSLDNIESDVFTQSGDDDVYMGEIPPQKLVELIQELPTGYKTVFNLFVFEDMSHKEIGMLLGINETASRSQYHRARHFLRKKIESILEKKK